MASLQQIADYRAWRYAEWEESDHPRADDGKFGEGAGDSDTVESVSSKIKKFATKVNLKGLSTAEARGVLRGLEDAMSIPGFDFKVAVVSIGTGRATESDGFGFGPAAGGTITIGDGGLRGARNHDPERIREMFKDEPIGKRNFAFQDAKDSEEYIRIAVAHEVGHLVEHSLFLDVQKAVREAGGLTENDILPLSGYATTHPTEMFAEVHAAMSTGREHLVPDKLQKVYRIAIANADPEPLGSFLRSSK